MNMQPGSPGLKNAQENQKIVLGGLRSLDPKQHWLIWLHQGSYFSHFPKNALFLVEDSNEGGCIPYIQTIQLEGNFVAYPLDPVHLITAGITRNSNETFDVAHVTIERCLEILRENRRPVEINFCALQISEVIEYLEEKERSLKERRIALAEEEKKLMEEEYLYEKGKRIFFKDRGIRFERHILFDKE